VPAAEPAGPSSADDQSAAPQRAPGGGSANGHAQQLHPPQASGHGGAADEDPDELDLYGDMAGAATQQRATSAENVCRGRMVWLCKPRSDCNGCACGQAARSPCPWPLVIHRNYAYARLMTCSEVANLMSSHLFAAAAQPAAGMQRQPSAAETSKQDAAAGVTASPASAAAGSASGQLPAGMTHYRHMAVEWQGSLPSVKKPHESVLWPAEAPASHEQAPCSVLLM